MDAPVVSAYVPCFNNASTIRRAVESLLSQTVPPRDVLVVDDGSTDGSAERAAAAGARVLAHPENRGRGAARATAMHETTADLVACCDATNALEPRFIEKALRWFDAPDVAAVVGRLTQPQSYTLADRWRGRHLFKLDVPQQVRRDATLATYGAVVRASAVAGVGGYDPQLRHTEDGDLGLRLRTAGLHIVYDPDLHVVSTVSNSLPEVMERYWRWYAGVDEAVSWRAYRKNIGYSIKGMAAADLRSGDLLAVPVSLLTPHYQFWRSLTRRWRRAWS